MDTLKCFLMLSVTWSLGGTTEIVELEIEDNKSSSKSLLQQSSPYYVQGKLFLNFSFIDL